VHKKLSKRGVRWLASDALRQHMNELPVRLAFLPRAQIAVEHSLQRLLRPTFGESALGGQLAYLLLVSSVPLAASLLPVFRQANAEPVAFAPRLILGGGRKTERDQVLLEVTVAAKYIGGRNS